MSRSSKKGKYAEPPLMKKIMAMKDAQIKKIIRIWSRKSAIFREFIGLTFDVYYGKEFIPVFVTDDIVGHNWAFSYI